MKLDRNEFWRQVTQGYAENYDIVNIEPGTTDLPLVATATMHMSESGYVLTRKAEMWSANSNEHVYFFSKDRFSSELCEQCINYAHEDGMSKIDLEGDANHMCTRIVAVFIADELSEGPLSEIKSCKIYKNFKMGLRGWMEMHAIGVDLAAETVCFNKYGRETAKFHDEIIHPEKRKKKHSKFDLLRKMLD